VRSIKRGWVGWDWVYNWNMREAKMDRQCPMKNRSTYITQKRPTHGIEHMPHNMRIIRLHIEKKMDVYLQHPPFSGSVGAMPTFTRPPVPVEEEEEEVEVGAVSASCRSIPFVNSRNASSTPLPVLAEHGI